VCVCTCTRITRPVLASGCSQLPPAGRIYLVQHVVGSTVSLLACISSNNDPAPSHHPKRLFFCWLFITCTARIYAPICRWDAACMPELNLHWTAFFSSIGAGSSTTVKRPWKIHWQKKASWFSRSVRQAGRKISGWSLRIRCATYRSYHSATTMHVNSKIRYVSSHW
jgi:hypothetical protein